MQILNIANKQHVEGFSKVWTHKGVAIFLDDVHKQFAIDFANMMLTSFIAEQQKKAAEAAKPKVALVED